MPGGALRLGVRWAGPALDLELVSAGKVLCAGEWLGAVHRNGEPSPATSAWQETCRVSDADVDYLELHIALAGGLRIERHLVLARKDRFLLLADALLGNRVGNLEYCGVLPLGPAVRFRPARQGCEGRLVDRAAYARVLPLALPEWRSAAAAGQLAAGGRGVQLRQAARGRRLLAPLFVDLDRRRLGRRLTWRQLTVAQALAVQPADVAVGYRVAIGSQQWLIYRSLAAKANRTLLGHNLATETLVARVDRKGTVTSIIEIE